MKFRYTLVWAEDTKGRFIKRPLVEVELIGKNGRNMRALALIDSGADITMVNAEYAVGLGLDLSTMRRKEFVGINAKPTSCYLSSIGLKVKYFGKELKVAVAFIDSPSVGVLLGQEDFFELFRIKFERDHNVFEITPVKR